MIKLERCRPYELSKDPDPNVIAGSRYTVVNSSYGGPDYEDVTDL